MHSDKIEYVNVLGTRISAVNPEQVLQYVIRTIGSERTGSYICVTGVHGVMEGLRNSNIRKAHNNGDMCVPDGMPMVWISTLSGHKNTRRCYGPDLMIDLLSLAAENGYTNLFYGGKEGVAVELKDRMTEKLNGLKVLDTISPPFRELTEEENNDTVSRINELHPDIIWVGLSTPKQEKLMANWSDKTNAKLMVGVGAAFDFHTNRLKQAPKWMQSSGLEWFFRLCVEPRRLWKRYLLNNPSFLFNLLLQRIHLRKYPLD